MALEQYHFGHSQQVRVAIIDYASFELIRGWFSVVRLTAM